MRAGQSVLAGRAALVAGGASGLGEATVRGTVREGAFVIILDRDTARGESLANELGQSVCFVQGDICQEADVRTALSGQSSQTCCGLRSGYRLVSTNRPRSVGFDFTAKF